MSNQVENGVDEVVATERVVTVTLRTEDTSVDLDAFVRNINSKHPEISVTVWKKKGKHVKKNSVEAVVN